MRVVVVGASGNIGTSVLAALRDDADVASVVAIARRPAARLRPPSVTWVPASMPRAAL
jgi:uncharacterized protein YbjT (DUF2867 family)